MYTASIRTNLDWHSNGSSKAVGASDVLEPNAVLFDFRTVVGAEYVGGQIE